ncbi:hypothetical protein [Campylobacter concisus]|uniref:hypothetical protein n=1 Tax=Campylobacter concisus TaxID=199 RepID=UPI000CD8EC50|nr:hypothetical protein [Campylobacter concisus]
MKSLILVTGAYGNFIKSKEKNETRQGNFSLILWKYHTILVGFYEDNNQIVPIELSMSYTYYKTKYGLFGDEGMGISFSKKSIVPVSGGNKFILTNNKIIKANKDK